MHLNELPFALQFTLEWLHFCGIVFLPIIGPFFLLLTYKSAVDAWKRFAKHPKSARGILSLSWRTSLFLLVTWVMCAVLLPFVSRALAVDLSAVVYLAVLWFVGCRFAFSNVAGLALHRREPDV